MKAKVTAAVTRRALIQRINRKLLQQDEALKTARGEQARMDLGEFFIVNLSGNYIVQKDCELEELGRELRVLAPYERLEG